MISNRNETLLRQEFKRRYLTEFSHYSGGLMEESAGHSANFLFMCAVMLTAPLSVPVAGLLGLGVSGRYAQVQKGVKEALTDTAAKVRAQLEDEDRALLPHVEKWLDEHIDELPGYLDRLDRFEDERRPDQIAGRKGQSARHCRLADHGRPPPDEAAQYHPVQGADVCRLSARAAMPAGQLAFLAAGPGVVAGYLKDGGRAGGYDPPHFRNGAGLISY